MAIGRLLLTAILALYGWRLARTQGPTFSLVDNINLPIHETGHLVFSPFGEMATVLGGTLFQLMVPLAFAISFLVRRDQHAASVMLWWAGQNCLYIGTYMADAVVQELPLVGGGEHDWEYLFGEWNRLAYSEQIGHDTRMVGGAIMLAATLWGLHAALTSRARAAAPNSTDTALAR